MSNFPEILIEDSKKKVSEIDKIMSKVEEISSERGKKQSELILLNLEGKQDEAFDKYLEIETLNREIENLQNEGLKILAKAFMKIVSS